VWRGRGEGGSRIIRSEIHTLINSVWSKEELPEQWKEPLIVPIYKKGNKIDFSNYGGTKVYPPSCNQG
jgi:hypothetical protein